jgi:acetyltransferase
MTATYPAQLTWSSTLADGTRVLIRPIRAEDRGIEQEFVRHLSNEAKYFRFMSAVSELSESMLSRFTKIDYDREMALIAVIAEGAHEQEIGVARYVINPDGKSCAFAVVVADAWQHRGIGAKLMICLMETAHSRGLQTMEGLVLSGNHKMLALMDALGFKVEPAPGDPTLRRVTRSLDSLPATAPAGRAFSAA